MPTDPIEAAKWVAKFMVTLFEELPWWMLLFIAVAVWT